MILGVASNGKSSPPIYIKEKEKVNTEVHISLLKKHVVSWLKRTFPDENYVLQQGGFPSHGAKKKKQFLKKNMANFWLKDFWPSSSPDLNPLDYSIWRVSLNPLDYSVCCGE